MFNADVPEEDIMGAIQRLDEKFQAEEFAFQLYKASGGYQFLTKPAYQASIGIMLKQQSKKRLSTSAMETLSIIAYRQPISKTEIENIRGVNCDYAVQKLLDKSLIEITGKADTIGRPMLYGTTPKFMEYFGINDLNELPVPKEAASEVNTIGQNSDSPELSLQNAEVEELLAEDSIEESPELHDEGHVHDEDMSLDQESTPSEEVTDSLALESEESEGDANPSTEEGTGEPDIESPDHHPEEPEKESDAQT
jgi:segregation and condensation protein B